MACWNGSDAGRVGRLLALVGALAPAAAPGETPADPEVYMADPITVTATRNPLPAFEFPGMVSVIGRQEMLRQQPSTPDDFLKWVPNMEFVGGPRRTGEVPSIRGFSGPDVVVTLDGARQNFDSAHDGRFFIDPSLLREVEVLRGPASALYGSGGNGGVIALRTLRAEDLLGTGERAGARLSGGYQSVNEEGRGTATVFGRPGGGLDLLGSVTRRSSGEIELGDGSTLDASDDDILAALMKLGWAPGADQRLEASFQRFRNEAEEPNNAQGAGGDDRVEKDIQRDNIRLAYGYQPSDQPLVDLDLTVYHTRFEADELRLDDRGAGPAGELLRRDLDTWGLRVENRSRPLDAARHGLTLTYGAEAYRDVQDGAAGEGERDGVPDADANFAAGFVQAEWRLSEPLGVLPGDLLLIPGLRFDHYATDGDLADSTVEDSALSPRLGLSYLPTDWSLLFASYSEAFRAPTFNELFLTGVHFRIPIGPGVTNRFVPNPDLDPQRTRTVEAGVGLDFRSLLARGDRLTAKASHFRTWGDDFIDLSVEQPEPFVDCDPFIPGGCDGVTRAANVAEARLWGSEVELSYENRRARIQAGYSNLHGRNDTTNEFLGVLTPAQLTLDAALKLPEVDSVLGWRMLAADDFDKTDDPAEERGGYAVHDFYLAWAPSGGPLAGLRLDLGVDNAFDRAYSRVFTGAPEPGRNLKAQLAYAVSF